MTQVAWRRRLDELICDENNFVFNAFLYLESEQRFENRVRIGGSGSCNNSASKYPSGYVEGDLTAVEEDNSTSNCSSQVWSEQKMCRWCEPYQSQKQDVCDEDHGCGRNMHEREKRPHQRR